MMIFSPVYLTKKAVERARKQALVHSTAAGRRGCVYPTRWRNQPHSTPRRGEKKKLARKMAVATSTMAAPEATLT